jgi:hypothetical protein
MKKKELLKRIERIEKHLNGHSKTTYKDDLLSLDKEPVEMNGTNCPDCSEGGLSLNKEKDIDFFEWWKKEFKKGLGIESGIIDLYECTGKYMIYIDGVIGYYKSSALINNQDKHQLARAILIYEIDKYNKNNNQTWGLEDFNSVVLDVSHRFIEKTSSYNGINVWNWYFGIKED